MSSDPLHDFVHKALSDLPNRRAPSTLIDRVNSMIAMREALPWYARGWTAWSVPARVCTAAAAVAAVALFVWLGVAGAQLFSATPVREIAVERAPEASALASAFWTVLEALKLAVERVAQPYLIGAVAVMVAGYTACIGAGASVYRYLHAHRE